MARGASTKLRWFAGAALVGALMLPLVGWAAGAFAASSASAGNRCSLEISDPATQGLLVRARAHAGSRVSVLGKNLRLSADGDFVFGVPYHQASPLLVLVAAPDGCKTAYRLAIETRKYAVERVDGLPSATVSPNPEEQARIAREAALITAGRAHDTMALDWLGTWRWPAQGRISGVYGSQRILNGYPRAPHLGLDIAAPVGTPVLAPLSGTVRMVHKDMLMTGGTLLVDHGFGVSTIYIHLSAIDVKQGQRVTAGQRIAAIGATGRASGPHLHLQVHWFQEKLDPALLLPKR